MGMKLLTKKIRDSLPALGATENVVAYEKVARCKFFDPCGSWTWYVVEGEQYGDDFRFFGLVDGFEREWGYFSLLELESVKGPLGLGIERDIHFENVPMFDVFGMDAVNL